MSKRDPFYLFFNIHRSERTPAVHLFFLAFFCGLSAVLLTSLSSTYFLKLFDASVLPLMYMAVGGMIVLLTPLFSFLERLISSRRFFPFLLVTQCLILLLFTWAPVNQSQLLGALFFIWCNVLLFVNNLALWGVANQVFSIRQGKRVFGFVGAGETLAEILGGFFTSLLIALLGIRWLMLISGISQLIMLFLIILLLSPSRDREEEKSREGEEKVITRHKSYLIQLFIFSSIVWIGFLFLENILYKETNARFSGEDAMTSFFGFFYALAGLITFLGKLFLSDKFVIRFGVTRAMIILPVCSILCFILYGLMSSLSAATTLLFFISAISLLLYKFFRSTVYKSGILVLYQPIPRKQRHQIFLAFERAGSILAGLVLFIVGSLLKLPYWITSFLLVPLFIYLVITAKPLENLYRKALKKALVTRTLDKASLSLEENIPFLEKSLASPLPASVLYALYLMEKNKIPGLAPAMSRLLNHPREIVRLKVLSRIEKNRFTSLLPGVIQLQERDFSPRVQGAALRVITALGGPRLIKTVSPYIRSSQLPVKEGALTGLLRYGGIEGVLLGGTELLRLVASEDPECRRTGANVIRKVGIAEFYAPLEALLEDRDPEVKRAALKAAGRIRSLELIPLLIRNLSDPRMREEAEGAILNLGGEAVPFLINAYGGDDDFRLALIKLLGQLKGGIPFLKELLKIDSKFLTGAVVLALQRCGYKEDLKDSKHIIELMEQEARDISFLFALRPEEPPGLFRRVLDEELNYSRKRVLALLSFITNSDSVIRAGSNIEGLSRDKKDYALELLDMALPRQVKDMLLPILEREWKTEPDRSIDYNNLSGENLILLLNHSMEWQLPWLGFFALVTASPEVYPLIQSRLTQLETVERWPFLRLGARYILDKMDGKMGQVSLPAKAKYLCGTDLFSGISSKIVLSIVPNLTEIEVVPGQRVITRGERGETMYLILQGRMVVERDSTPVVLEEGDVLGELSILDEEPRSANVTALTPGRLLVVDQQAFYGFINKHRAISFEIIKVLADRVLASVSVLRGQEREFPVKYKNLKLEGPKEKDVLIPLEKFFFLKSIPYFSGLPGEVLHVLAREMEEKVFLPGEVIVSEEEKAEFIVILIAGEVRDSCFRPHLKIKGHHYLYGEIEFFRDISYGTTVTALKPTLVYRLQGPRLALFIEQYRMLGHRVIRVLTRSFRRLQKKREE